MFLIYQFTILLLIIISPIIIIIRILKKKEDKKRFIEKFSIISKKREKGNLIWFHGSSVGEILSIIPIVEKLEKNKLVKKILITSSTLSSSQILTKYNFKKTTHQFFPIDFTYFTNKFLNFWKPSIAIFIESEIWPSMFLGINKRSIPIVLMNARITEKTFKRWMKIESFSKNVFGKINFAYPQNRETYQYLKRLEVSKINFIGNLKFSESKLDEKILINKKFYKQFTNRKVWCASSTHADEELDCAKVHINLKRKYKNLLTIIIPRHIHRTDEIIKKINDLGLNITQRSSNKKITKNTDIYLVDTYGETKKFYKISKTVFLGGSLINHGGQNPIEPARLQSTIIHGVHIHNFREVYKLLDDNKISYKAKNIFQLTKLVDRSISNSKTKKNKYLKIKKLGNTILNNTMNEINDLIKHEIKKT